MTYPLAGERLVTGMFVSHVAKAGATSRSSTITVAADPELALALGVGNWEVETLLRVQGDGGDFQCEYSFSGSASIVRRGNIGPATSMTSVSDTNMRSSHNAGSTDLSYGTIAGTDGFLIERLYVTVTVAGTLTLNWSQNASNVNATILGIGSTLMARRVG